MDVNYTRIFFLYEFKLVYSAAQAVQNIIKAFGYDTIKELRISKMKQFGNVNLE